MSAKSMIKIWDIWIQCCFYLIAGFSHLIFPDFYQPLIPEYLTEPDIINLLAGLSEILLGIMIIIPRTRIIASYGLTLMLLVYSLSHIHYIHCGPCFEGSLCLPTWVGWFRLIIIHPLLIFWARRILMYSQIEGSPAIESLSDT